MDDSQVSCGGCDLQAPSPEPSSGIGRRTFLAQAAVMAAVAALAACGAGGDSLTAPDLTSSTTIRLADQPALANVGGVALITISSRPFAVVRTGSASFVTLSRVCPHQGSTVNPTGNGFLCPNHGAQFSSNGTWVGGQPTSSLRSYPTTYDAAAGTITIG
jgi:cytochrome b6-f complex iron-sulfur subunit